MSIAAILIAILDSEPLKDLEALIAAAEEGNLPSCILETAWQALHWLFTGTADGGDEPWCYLLKREIEITTKEQTGWTVCPVSSNTSRWSLGLKHCNL
ncbi:MAG: hypothetical protein ACK4K5_06220 [Thermosynechococcus sp.]|uniref:hypothetical protein n=1 Tax=Thermosynechococcus sp. TaxID=2814275 RepID=UPI0039197D61